MYRLRSKAYDMLNFEVVCEPPANSLKPALITATRQAAQQILRKAREWRRVRFRSIPDIQDITPRPDKIPGIVKMPDSPPSVRGNATSEIATDMVATDSSNDQIVATIQREDDSEQNPTVMSENDGVRFLPSAAQCYAEIKLTSGEGSAVEEAVEIHEGSSEMKTEVDNSVISVPAKVADEYVAVEETKNAESASEKKLEIAKSINSAPAKVVNEYVAVGEIAKTEISSNEKMEVDNSGTSAPPKAISATKKSKRWATEPSGIWVRGERLRGCSKSADEVDMDDFRVRKWLQNIPEEVDSPQTDVENDDIVFLGIQQGSNLPRKLSFGKRSGAVEEARKSAPPEAKTKALQDSNGQECEFEPSRKKRRVLAEESIVDCAPFPSISNVGYAQIAPIDYELPFKERPCAAPNATSCAAFSFRKIISEKEVAVDKNAEPCAASIPPTGNKNKKRVRRRSQWKVKSQLNMQELEQNLWSEVSRPMEADELSVDRGTTRELRNWLEAWKTRLHRSRNHQTDKKVKRRRHDICQDSDDDENNLYNTAIIYGPSGSGKTSLVYALARRYGMHVLELASNEKRNGAQLKSKLQGAAHSHKFSTAAAANYVFPLAARKNEPAVVDSLILIDDCDVVYDEQDDGFWYTLKNLCREARTPIILTCEDVDLVHRELGAGISFLTCELSRPQPDTATGQLKVAFFAVFLKLTVYALARRYGMHVLEVASNEKRNGAQLKSKLQGAAHSHKFSTATTANHVFPLVARKNEPAVVDSLILIDDCDVVYDEQDDGFWYTLKSLCREARTPIILTCEDVDLVRRELGAGISFLTCELSRPQSDAAAGQLKVAFFAVFLKLTLLCDAANLNVSAAVCAALVEEYKCDLRACINHLQEDEFEVEFEKTTAHEAVRVTRIVLPATEYFPLSDVVLDYVPYLYIMNASSLAKIAVARRAQHYFDNFRGDSQLDPSGSMRASLQLYSFKSF
ncbi:unnamed protein product [Gongylonema pulchrum]|uniref:AAA domain-containing protein n=1 Tax=Gongylonema pulchrum TaxID=637853 RepID=A0A183DP92_9BILA|nr:unnamed protein product [Gongylonema pulchrum]